MTVRCKGRSVVRDDDGQPVRGPDGKRTYRPCRAWAMKGQQVCSMHGGTSPQAKRKAKERIATKRLRAQAARSLVVTIEGLLGRSELGLSRASAARIVRDLTGLVGTGDPDVLALVREQGARIVAARRDVLAADDVETTT